MKISEIDIQIEEIQRQKQYHHDVVVSADKEYAKQAREKERMTRMVKASDPEAEMKKLDAEDAKFTLELVEHRKMMNTLAQQVDSLKAQRVRLQRQSVSPDLVKEHEKELRKLDALKVQDQELRNKWYERNREYSSMHSGGPGAHNMSIAAHDSALAKLMKPMSEIEDQRNEVQKEINRQEQVVEKLRDVIEAKMLAAK